MGQQPGSISKCAAAIFLRVFWRLVHCCCVLCLVCACGVVSKDSEMRSEKMTSEERAELQGTPIPYTVNIIVEGNGGELKKLMQAASVLYVNKSKPPDSLLGIERRARLDRETALQLLHSQCYYEGQASYEMKAESSPIQVELRLNPGVRYHLGRANVFYHPKPVLPQAFTNRYRTYGLLGLEREALPTATFPEQLPKVHVGKPVTADAMLEAVEAHTQSYHTKGFPLAKVEEARYTLDPDLKALNAEIHIALGPCVTFGEVRVHGNTEVRSKYIRSWIPWKVGKEPYDSDALEQFANELRHTGLFRQVEAKPAINDLKTGKDGIACLPIDVEVKEAPFRTVGANVHYDTSTGFGVEGSWEHRNLFHNGEKLTVRAPIATQEQGLKFAFEKPNFLAREQKLYANLALLHEKTSAYERIGANFDGGVERRLTRTLYGGAGVFADVGQLKDNQHSKQTYSLYGPQFFLRHDSRNNHLNPTQGSTLKWTIKPFAGTYSHSFAALGQTLGGSFYYAPLKDNDGGKSDALVLAARFEGGSILGAKTTSLPTSVRYFTGGAGSVRGYSYQAIGPRDKSDDPAGGRSYQLVNFEARFKMTDSIGLVPFVDGGMVYKDEVPKIIGDMRWGAGLGLRYFTPIGPLRFDVATPLNPIKGDPPVQIYISIGQSF